MTLLQASAGTGKTFTITALITRFVAEGVSLDAILAVTFTRMATGELRDRVRRRLVTAADGLARHLDSGEPIPPDDQVLVMLSEGPRPEVELRRTRLANAVASFDAATIATTHGFCRLVLDGLGSAGDVPAGAGLLEDPADLIDEVVDDLYLRWALRHGPPLFRREEARVAVSEAVRNPGIRLVPPPGDDAAGLLRRLVEAADKEVSRRLQDDNLLTFDHVLSRLAATLEDPRRGPVACDRLRRRFGVVLVDEFQDTDPIQWRVVDRAFGDGTTRLILVGDPKQAIYSFRGADVHAYLDAAGRAQQLTLAVNWRADQSLLDATQALLDPLEMGDPEIRFLTVAAPAERAGSALAGFPCSTPIRIRLVSNNQPGLQKTLRKGLLHKASLVEWIAGDVARDVARLLESDARIGDCRVVPADIAVLTRTNKQSSAVRDALRTAGVAAVIAGLDSVFGSEAAGHWLRLLEALEEPASRSRAVAVSMTPWIGMTAIDAAQADEHDWETVHARIHRWSAILTGYGVAALYRSITATEGLPGRVVHLAGGERTLTDLGHVAELLHAESATSQMGIPTLRGWLARRIAEVDTDEAGAEERTRRLDSDAAAVQVLTVHRAKGLEFGVVYCPYLWDAALGGRSSGPVVFHDPAAGGTRTLDVGCADRHGPARALYDEHCRLARNEERGEELRLMYVALTRARHQVVLWWGRADQCRHSPLGRLLLCRDRATGAVGEARASDPRDDEIHRALGALLDHTPAGLIATELAAESVLVGAGPQDEPFGRAGLSAARFERSLDLRWRRASYTSITAPAEKWDGRTVGSEPEDPGMEDEPAAGAPGDSSPSVTDGQPAEPETAGRRGNFLSPMAELPAGAEFGIHVHRLMEEIDFEQPDFSAVDPGGGPPGLDPVALTAGLEAVLSTPLGPALDGMILSALSRRDRLDEMRFELPMAGGEQPTGQVSTGDIAAVISPHLPPGEVFSGYPDRLADPLLHTELRGYLTGSLDLVFRRAGGDGVTRWYVADYKTNRLGPSSLDYRTQVLEREMQRHHYPLQALLYLVALHRYLHWRLPGYHPGTHLGGVLYLFVRGMIGPETPTVDGQPCGVLPWAPPAGLVVDLSQLFGGDH